MATDNPDIIPINDRHAFYDNKIGKACCRYILDLSKPQDASLADRTVDSLLRYIPQSASILSNQRYFAGQGYCFISKEEFFGRLLDELPEVFEFLLWHPELL